MFVVNYSAFGSIVSPNSETAGRALNYSKLATFDNCYVIALASFKTLRLKGSVNIHS